MIKDIAVLLCLLLPHSNPKTFPNNYKQMTIFAALASLTALASACTPDLLIDNFPSIKQAACRECGAEPDGSYPTRFFNLIEGDYGAKDATVSVNPSATGAGGNMEILAGWGKSPNCFC